MDVVTGIIIILGLLFIDHRLNKIFKEMRQVNQFLEAYWKRLQPPK